MCGWVPSDPGDSPDRSDALCWAVHELSGLSAGSWLAAYGTVRCETCETAYPESYGACPACHPQQARKPAPREKDGAPRGTEPMGGWASAYGAVRCPRGHAYIGRLHKDCPRCAPGGAPQRSPFPLGSLPGVMARRF